MSKRNMGLCFDAKQMWLGLRVPSERGSQFWLRLPGCKAGPLGQAVTVRPRVGQLYQGWQFYDISNTCLVFS